MENEIIKLELDEKTMETINYIHRTYFFGMFIVVGIAKDKDTEYLLRNALENFYKAAKEAKK